MGNAEMVIYSIVKLVFVELNIEGLLFSHLFVKFFTLFNQFLFTLPGFMSFLPAAKPIGLVEANSSFFLPSF